MNPEEQAQFVPEAPEVFNDSFEHSNVDEVAPFDQSADMLNIGEVNADVIPDLGDVATDDGVVDLADLSEDVVADLADLPDENITDVNAEGSAEFGADGEVLGNPENPEEPILPPPNLDEMFSEESIRKLREAIENSPCYQRRLAAYRQQQEQLGKSLDIGPSSPMISPLYKLQFFGSYLKGMIQLVQHNYLVLLLIGLLAINAVLFYNYFTNVSDQKKHSKEKKLKKAMKEKAEKLAKDDI